MVAARLLFALLATLLLVGTAHGAPAAPAAPQGLHGFLFRADEPVRREFARTPSFAWSPVRGAIRYEFELATSNTFRENGLIYADRELTTPVASLMLTLPWITGSPYALYARVRAVLPRNAVTAWSAPFGFNMRQEAVPKPLPSMPGLLRWTPIEGAAAYQVWMVDQGQSAIYTVSTNVMDQREAYTFHQSEPWIGKIRWRIRSLRWDVSEEDRPRANGLPASSASRWSPVYESENPALDTGEIRLIGTLSDVVSTGRNGDRAHRLMPAFAFTGARAPDGELAELFRVYVFTDSDCLNRVFTSSVFGSPAFAPRPFGSLALPRTSVALAAARTQYLWPGSQGRTYAFDFEEVEANEEREATPTLGLPAAEGGTSGDAASINFLKVSGDHRRAAIDLWDTNWPEGGYYWTVVPVAATSPGDLVTDLAEGAAAAATSLRVISASGFRAGDTIRVGAGANAETVSVTAATGNTLGIATPLARSHGAGARVERMSGDLVYRDLELPQEACANGRVLRFGKSSEPTLVAAGAPFASGLSPRGRLTAAASSAPSFYRSPLVAWTPALGSDAYHVQWSKTRYPFRPESVAWRGRGAASGFMTFATSAVLPLQPGTWWYRVRGVSFGLPTNAQFMSWSDPARLVVTKPVFAVKKRPKR